ncbi:MAG: hypothetical protein NUV69_03190 [Candidatus Curtissbacteria bacterium]|nr:hypothetical protein [Candidatus Curtissbacteria bacterium]
MKHSLFRTFANFSAVVLLLALLAFPFYFASKFAQVAGVKSASHYLIVPQIDKFPNVSFSQEGETYKLTATKFGESQAFLGILILNNPTEETKTYSIEKTAGEAKVFFGQDFKNPDITATLSPQTSTTLSLLSEEASASSNVSFKIKAQ